MCWPALPAFCMHTKGWGQVLVENLKEVDFKVDAFDQLVLEPKTKKIIKALVEHQSAETFSDIVAGKGGGCIFLLHGPPGVGKTTSAEAVAEVLKRPLYSVTVGELGTDAKSLEKSLTRLLQIAGRWNAVILLDEADIFLETRTDNDVLRNAMVGIFLRLLGKNIFFSIFV